MYECVNNSIKTKNKNEIASYISLISIICITIITSIDTIYNESGKNIIIFFKSIGALGYPISLMILGYTMTNKKIEIKEYYKRFIIRVIIPLVIYLLLYKTISNGIYDIKWFTNTLIGVIILAPFINIFLNNIKDKDLYIFLCGFIALRAIQIYLPQIGINVNIDLWYLNNWTIFFVLGNLLSRIESEHIKVKIYKFGLISFILTLVLAKSSIDVQIFGVSPTMILYSSAVFLKLIGLNYEKVTKFKFLKKSVNFLYKHNLGIYLIQSYIITNILGRCIGQYLIKINPFICIITLSFTGIVISSIVAMITDRVIIEIYTRAVSIGIKPKLINHIFIEYKQYLIWILLSMILTICLECINRGSINNTISFINLNTKRFIINYLMVLAITSPSILYNKLYLVFSLISEILCMLSIASYVIYSFRGTPLTYSDFSSIKDGITIAKEYLNFKIIVGIVIVLLIIVLILYKSIIFDKKLKLKLNKISLILIPITIAISGYSIEYGLKTNILVPNQWDLKVSYDDNGFIYSLYNSYNAFKKEKPELYNEENIVKIKNKMENTYKKIANNENPNIIIIQLESVMDPQDIDGVKFSKDPFANFRQISEKFTSGLLQVPTMGGGTARSEFEVLSGMSLDYFSPGEIPHNNDLKKQAVESIAYSLDDKNYDKTLIHNYRGSFYGRNKAYENLGFKRYIPLEYMYNVDYPYIYPSDKLILENIKKTLEKSEKRDFIFGIGVQTHGSYSQDYKNENSEVKVSGDLPEPYLNQIQDFVDDLIDVDNMLKELVEYIENLDEPTILAVYSDHLPGLEVVNNNFDSEKKYQAPYFIYDNMDLEKNDEDLEAYQLSTKILNSIGMNGGIMNNYHNTYMNSENYQQGLQLLQYDLLYGERYITDRKQKYRKASMTMGLEDIIIEDVKINNNVIEVKGRGFNEYSCINIDNKQINTEYIDSSTLRADIDMKKINKISVSQLSLYSKPIGVSNYYILD